MVCVVMTVWNGGSENIRMSFGNDFDRKVHGGAMEWIIVSYGRVIEGCLLSPN